MAVVHALTPLLLVITYCEINVVGNGGLSFERVSETLVLWSKTHYKSYIYFSPHAHEALEVFWC